MKRNVTELLSSKDDRFACACTAEIISGSRESNEWVEYFDEFASLLNHPKSLVRNRALSILAANAKWDEENRFERILPEYLSHITDEKPITARQCVKALQEVGQAKPNLIPEILAALRGANLSRYRDSMRPLIEKDIRETIQKLSPFVCMGESGTEIQIRHMMPDDFAPLHQLLSDPEVMKYLEPPFSQEQTKRFLEEEGLCSPPRIYTAELQKKFIGYVIWHPYDEESMEIGWVLLPEYWGYGYASEITKHLIEKAKRDRKAVVMECVPQQAASRRIAEKCGFAYCGRNGGLDEYKRIPDFTEESGK